MPTRHRTRPVRQKVTEAELQDAVVEFAQRNGWMAFWIPDWMYRLAIQSMMRMHRHDRQWSPPGFPDLVLLQGLADRRRPVRLIFVELKSQKGTVREKQLEWLRGLRRIEAVEVYCLRPDDWLDGTVDKILLNGPMREHPGTIRELEAL